MDLKLDGKVAMVAAGSKGIGRATALGLSEEGATVSICARGQKALAETVNDCPGPAMGVEADVTEHSDIKTFVKDTVEAYGGIDILVNNAGGPPSGGFQDMEPDKFRDALELNLMSTINLTKEALPHLKQQEWGRIITVTSVSVKQPLGDLVLSNTARSGATAALKTLSNEVADENITVNCVLPGLTATDRMKELTEDQAERQDISVEQAREQTVSNVPMDRWADPGEIADVAVFLASERASFVTGTNIQVDGGFISNLL
ncbi:MAG: SDR family oxidoreductase [bacterium]